jgi:hypothetical protein
VIGREDALVGIEVMVTDVARQDVAPVRATCSALQSHVLRYGPLHFMPATSFRSRHRHSTPITCASLQQHVFCYNHLCFVTTTRISL